MTTKTEALKLAREAICSYRTTQAMGYMPLEPWREMDNKGAQALNAIDAALAEPDGWQPIETAPQSDDAEFLGWDGFSVDRTWPGWMEDDDKVVYVCGDFIRCNPTHWMPIHTPPTDTGSKT